MPFNSDGSFGFCGRLLSSSVPLCAVVFVAAIWGDPHIHGVYWEAPSTFLEQWSRGMSLQGAEGGYFDVLYSLTSDGKNLIVSKAIRMYSFGYLAVMLVLYLKELAFKDNDIGLLFTLTILGDVVISMWLTTHADRFGRKRTMILGSILAIITACIFAYTRNFWVLVFAGVFGVISPSGNEIGPLMAIEISSLSEVTISANRTMLMAWYNLVSCISSALGALSCGLLIDSLQKPYGLFAFDLTLLESCQYVLLIYTTLQVLQLYCVLQLSPSIEVPDRETAKIDANPITKFLGLHKSKWIVIKLSLLFMMDSFGGSFILQSIVSGWFYGTYHTPGMLIGTMVFICNLVAGISALFAAKLADKIGLIATMVVTHLPSNILIILVPLMPTQALAMTMLCLRYSISQMDVPTRNAYVQGVVDADERSAANGVTNVVRSIGASTGPYLAGFLYANEATRDYPFYIAGGIKIVYDLLLLWNMSGTPTDDEKLKQQQQQDVQQPTESTRLIAP